MLAHEEIRALAHAQGFEVVGVIRAEPLLEDLERLRSWAQAGHGAGLGYMTRNPPQRADARTLLAGVCSVVSVAVPYGAAVAPFEHERRYGRVARYAWGRDYHEVVLPRLRALGAALAARFGGPDAAGASGTKAACDHSPILERAFAARAGLGFVGKNTCFIRPGHGSWFLLGEVLLEAELPPTPPAHDTSADLDCGTCQRCLVACPTRAFVAPFVLDARRCISYWTIETQEPFPRELRSQFGAWVFGCDDCQTICPFNAFDPRDVWPELLPEAGVGPRLDLAATLTIASEEAYARRFAGTALKRTGRVGLLRGAAVAARNVGAVTAWRALEELVRHDPVPVLRAHALWALAGLDPDKARPLLERARTDPDPLVRAEVESLSDSSR